MKQKFFTFLAMLMFVSVNAVADGTVSVSISAKYGATTFVCNQDLDFSGLCSDAQHIVMKPYYISDYSKENGSFTLTAFGGATVPAYTPMILLGTAHTSAGATDVITEEVPVISMNSDAATDKRDAAFGAAGGYCWLVPAIASSYEIPGFVGKQAGRGSLPATNVTFYDNTAKSFPLYVKQTESDIFYGYSSRNEITANYTYSYYDMLPLSETGLVTDNPANYAEPWDWLSNEENFYEGDFDFVAPAVDTYVVLWAYTVDRRGNKTYKYGLYKWGDDEGAGYNYWQSQGRLKVSDTNYDGTVSKWYNPDLTITEYTTNMIFDVSEDRDFTNYVLSVNSEGKPVFKKCNSSSNGGAGTTVAAGKCYVRVWNDVLVGAAAAREDIGWTFEEEEDLNSFEENTTGIKDVKNIKNKKEIFNMKGQKLEKMQKGLNIVNGKKVYVK